MEKERRFPKTVVVDIDRTIVRDSNVPIEPIVKLVNCLFEHYNIVFVTGRGQSLFKMTNDMLMKLFPGKDIVLCMHNDISILDSKCKHICNIFDVAFIIEDQDDCVKMYRDLGYTVLQPDYGDVAL